MSRLAAKLQRTPKPRRTVSLDSPEASRSPQTALSASPCRSHHQTFKLSDGRFFGDAVDNGNLSRKAFECSRIELSFAVALAGIELRPIEIAHRFCDGENISRLDLALIFLSKPGPITTRSARRLTQDTSRLLDGRRIGKLTHPDTCRLSCRNSQRHFAFRKIDDKELKLSSCHRLFLDRDNLPDAVSRVHDQIGCLESKARLDATAPTRLIDGGYRYGMRRIRTIGLRLIAKIHFAICPAALGIGSTAISRRDQSVRQNQNARLKIINCSPSLIGRERERRHEKCDQLAFPR